MNDTIIFFFIIFCINIHINVLGSIKYVCRYVNIASHLCSSQFDTVSVVFLNPFSLTVLGGTNGTEASSPSTIGFPANTTLIVLVYTSLGMPLSLHTERKQIP